MRSVMQLQLWFEWRLIRHALTLQVIDSILMTIVLVASVGLTLSDRLADNPIPSLGIVMLISVFIQSHISVQRFFDICQFVDLLPIASKTLAIAKMTLAAWFSLVISVFVFVSAPLALLLIGKADILQRLWHSDSQSIDPTHALFRLIVILLPVLFILEGVCN